MRPYTTPTLTCTVSGYDLTDFDVYVTIKQASVVITKSGDDLEVSYDSDEDVSTIEVSLEQADTALFVAGKDASVQANWISSDGTRVATRIKPITIETNLLNEELTYGE